MNGIIKKEYLLKGLNCGHCAAKIESAAKQIPSVTKSNMDLMNQTLSLELLSDEPTLLKTVQDIVKKYESDVLVEEKEAKTPSKKVLILSGLDCADCAAKVERALIKTNQFKSVHLDFVTQRLTLEVEDKEMLPVLIRSASQIIKEIEPDVEVQYSGEKEGANNESSNKAKIIRFAIGAGLFALGIFIELPFWYELALFLTSYILVGGDVVLRAGRNILKGQVFDENFLMTVATIGAFAIKDFPEGVAVMLFYQVGEFFQDLAVNRSRKSITSLMDIRPDYVNLKLGEEIRRVSPEEVAVSELFVVKAGEKVPLDGVIVEGYGTLDTKALTGESLPREVGVGDEVLSGAVNQSGLLVIKATKSFGDSTVSKILDLVQNASSKKAPAENFITKFARYYTPLVVFAAIGVAIIPPLMIEGAVFSEWIHRALVFLVVSCPCALVVSIPLSFFGGIGGASKNGILVKGSSYLEALNNVDTVVFDKTGTLTKGVFTVTEIHSAAKIDREKLLYVAAHAEYFSNHPIGQSIIKAYQGKIEPTIIQDYEEIAGKGICVAVNGQQVLIGNKVLLEEKGIGFEPVQAFGTIVYTAVDGEYYGAIVIADEVKDDSKEAISLLKKLGIKKTIMLTGDVKSVGNKIGEILKLDQVYAELLPHQKVEEIEKISQAAKGKVMFVGDGINDAPVLARADIGVAMGALGSDAAIEAADIVLMTDEPSKIASSIQIARKTRAIVWQNIIFALLVKGIILVLAAGGMASMWEAVFGDVGVALIAILNAMRVMRVEKGNK